MDFELYLRKRAKREPIATPQGYDKRIAHTLNALQGKEQAQKGTKKRYAKVARRLPVAAVIAIIVLCVGGTVLAVNLVLKMQGSKIEYFEGAQEQDFASQQDYWEDTSDEVDVPVPDQSAPKEPISGDLGAAITNSKESGSTEGVSLTIDNIAMDMNYLNVFYTIKTKKPIKQLFYEGWKDEGMSEEEFFEIYHEDMIPTYIGHLSFGVDVDGEPVELLESGGRGGEGHMVDANTLSGVFTCGLVDNVPQAFALRLKTEYVLGQEGLWEANFDIDLTDVFAKSKVVYPKRTIQIAEVLPEELKDRYEIEDLGIVHNVVVERVSLTENGGMIILGEQTPPPVPLKQEAWDEMNRHYEESRQEAEAQGATEAELPELAPMEEQAYSSMPYVDFMVFDDKGNALSRATGSGGVYGGSGYIRNVLEFATDDMDINSITLAPYRENWDNKVEINVMFDEIGKEYEIFPGASVKLVDVLYDEETEYGGEISTNSAVTLKYIEKGVPVSSYSKTRFLDKDGGEADLAATMSSENPYVDFATGIKTDWIAVEFPDDNPGDIKDFTGMVFEYNIPDVDHAKDVTITF